MEWVCPIDAPGMMTVPTVSLRQGESEGLAKQFRAVIEMDKSVGQSQGAVEPALVVCGRHGTEDFRLTPGELGAFVPFRGR